MTNLTEIPGKLHARGGESLSQLLEVTTSNPLRGTHNRQIVEATVAASTTTDIDTVSFPSNGKGIITWLVHLQKETGGSDSGISSFSAIVEFSGSYTDGFTGDGHYTIKKLLFENYTEITISVENSDEDVMLRVTNTDNEVFYAMAERTSIFYSAVYPPG